MELVDVDVVDEGEVVGGVPVQAVAEHVEGDRVDQLVDGGDDLENQNNYVRYAGKQGKPSEKSSYVTKRGFF